MKFHFFIVFAIIALYATFSHVSAQSDSVIGQITSSPNESFAGGISGDGRFVVFESNGNLATENPRNTDGNREIFIFDYAQRRIFQITDTRSLLTNATGAATFDNIRVEILSIRPVISNNGRWIAFGSNATTAFPATSTTPEVVSATNPGNFDANAFTVRDASGNFVSNPLTGDGNTEMWLYQIPAVAPVANLSSGAEIQPTDLSSGTFTRVTNTAPSRLPVAGTTTAGPVIADDNREATINIDGNYIAFVSNRDLVPTGNASPNNNDEIFSYVRSGATTSQVTSTPRGAISAPIFNSNPSISGNGLRIAFASNADKPVAGTDGTNTDNNIEIFYTDLNANGTPDLTRPRRQITNTTRSTPGQIINVFDLGRRMSLDGRYIAFDSFADLATSGAPVQTSFALYLFDTTTSAFRQIGPRSDADSAANGGDVQHYPGFTDYRAGTGSAPETLVFETRLNITANGTVAATAADGLNPDAARPAQIYSVPLNSTAPTFTRLTRFPPPSLLLASTQPIPSNFLRRMTFTLALTEIGTGNTDLANEAYYFLLPAAATQSTATLSFATGASRISVSASPVPTPTPGTTPTPSPSPTPQTPSAVQGVSPGMLAIANFTSGSAVVSQTVVGSLARRFTLPIELNGVTVTVNGAASGIKSVSPGEVFFVVPPGLPAPLAGTVYPIVINDNGTVVRGSITVVPARPDIFTFLPAPGPN
ncbi:MAG: hypothetical protein M3525_08725, partial [Acidobacteriota bacterium]|nr:hypothetical protein [Acidobacteriota bacterium]